VIGLPLLFAAGTRRPGQSFGDRIGEVGDAIGRSGEAMQRTGFRLTMLVTLPLVGFVIFGLVGAVIGLLLGVAFVGESVSRKT